MSTLSFYENQLPLGDESLQPTTPIRDVKVFVSDLFGSQELYLSVGDDKEAVRLSKADAQEFFESLKSAMGYLNY